MPLHDWTRVPAGLFHDFHQGWSIRIRDALNAGLLPRGFSALVEQKSGPLESDVLAIESRTRVAPASNGGVAVAERPKARIVRRTTKDYYVDLANRIVVKHHLGRIVAVVEIVSPGNKDSKAAMRNFLEKTVDYLRRGVHVLVIDLFPPTPRDPFGIHKLIWDEFEEEEFQFPPGKDRILASYETGRERAAYIEPIAVGDVLPDMPLFLTNFLHTMTPLELTYMQNWNVSSEALRLAVETGVLPEPEGE
jgi:hypothetical protein